MNEKELLEDLRVYAIESNRVSVADAVSRILDRDDRSGASTFDRQIARRRVLKVALAVQDELDGMGIVGVQLAFSMLVVRVWAARHNVSADAPIRSIL